MTRRVPLVLPILVVGLLAAEVTWAWHRTPPLFEWEPDKRQVARAEAEAWLALSARKDDVLFGYEPLFLGAWETEPVVLADASSLVPTPRLALRLLESDGAARSRRLGPRRERAQQRPAPARDRCRQPHPRDAFEVQGVRPVPRHANP